MTIFRDNRALLDAFRRGDKDALRAIYDRYCRQVEAVARRGAMLGQGARFAGAPRAECRDLVQETFVRAFSEKNRLAFDGLRDYQPFLLTIARNVLAEWWRKRGREMPSDETLDAAAPEEAEDFDPREVAQVQEHLESLPPDLKAVYEQRYVHDRSQVDAAAALKISRQNLRTLEQRLQAAVKKWLRRKKINPNAAPPQGPSNGE